MDGNVISVINFEVVRKGEIQHSHLDQVNTSLTTINKNYVLTGKIILPFFG